jgi:hypothetical protein
VKLSIIIPAAELVMKCAKLAREKDVQLAEVEIGYHPRSFEEGKKNQMARWAEYASRHLEVSVTA